jgi:hypothetical protein
VFGTENSRKAVDNVELELILELELKREMMQ